MTFRHLWVVAAGATLCASAAPGQNAASAQQSAAAAHAVLERVMPHLSSQIHLSLEAGDYDGKADGFKIHGGVGNIHVEAATTPTLLFGVNWYLKYVAH